jgi:hypothetical protein
MSHIDGRAITFDCQFYDTDCTVDAGAKAARRGNQDIQFRAIKLRNGRNICRCIHSVRALAQQRGWGKGASSCCASFIAPIRSGAQGRRVQPFDLFVPVLESLIAMKPNLLRFRKFIAILCGSATMATAAGCAKDNDIDVSSGVGITATRDACPAVAVPLHTGDITLFDPPSSREARAIDVVATVTNLTSQCNDEGEKVYQLASFDVVATRRDAGPARNVDLPYFSTVVQGGTAVIAKRIGKVTISFAEGSARGTGRGQASAYVDRAAATLPEDIRERITRRRRAGDQDAAIDPLSLPEVRDAVQRASFELLVGFQLTPEQLEYNVRR